MKKVGIYGGSFDPIHQGHLAFAHEAIEQCGLDKVFFLVEPRPRRKQGVKALEHRHEMVQLAIQDEPKFGSILLGQQRFTPHETLPVLAERFKGAELHMLMGDDLLSHFAGADWPHFDELVRGMRFVIGLRHYSRAEVEHRMKIIQDTTGLKLRYRLFQGSLPEFSSSTLRASVRHGHKPRGISDAVYQYIRQEGLYAPGTSSEPSSAGSMSS